MAITKTAISNNDMTAIKAALDPLVTKGIASAVAINGGETEITVSDSDNHVILKITKGSNTQAQFTIYASASVSFTTTFSNSKIRSVFVTESGAWLDVDTNSSASQNKYDAAAVIGKTNSGKTGVALQTALSTSNQIGTVVGYSSAWGAEEIAQATYNNIRTNKNQVFSRGVAICPPFATVMYLPDIEIADMTQYTANTAQPSYEIEISGTHYVTNGYLFLKDGGAT